MGITGASLEQREQFRMLQIQPIPNDSTNDGKGTVLNTVVTRTGARRPVTKGSYLNITEWLGEEAIVIEDGYEEIGQISFTIIKYAEWLHEVIHKGMRVRFKGGYLFGGQEWLFNGYITHWEPVHRDDGRVFLNVKAQDDLWRLTMFSPGHVTYPTVRMDNPLYLRAFHYVDQIKLSEIVKGVLDDYDLDVGMVEIKPEDDYVFTLQYPLVQNEDETDFQFLTRILTGESQGGGHTNNGEDEPEVHGHARMFVQTSGTEEQPESKVFVLSEQLMLDPDASLGTQQFFFHRQDGKTIIVTPEAYNPDKPDAKMIIMGVQVRETSDSKGKESMRRSESARTSSDIISALFPHAKKGKGGGQPVVGKTAEVEHSKEGPAGPISDPPGGWNSWEIDEAAVFAGEEAGEFGDDAFALDVLKSWPWEKAKKYFKPREVRYVPSNTPMSAQGHADDLQAAKDVPEPGGTPVSAEGHSKKKKSSAEGGRRAKTRKQHDPKVKQWGIDLECFSPHGNPTLMARKIYPIQGLLGRYSGNWFLGKIRHKFAKTYTNEFEFHR